MRYKHTAHGLLVDDVNKSAPFYRDILGYPIVRTGISFILFDAEGEKLFMWEWGHLVEHLGEEAMSHVKHRVQYAIRFDAKEEVDLAYQELKGKNVKFVADPADWPWNAHAAYFVDDDGYMWELFAWLQS